MVDLTPKQFEAQALRSHGHNQAQIGKIQGCCQSVVSRRLRAGSMKLRSAHSAASRKRTGKVDPAVLDRLGPDDILAVV